MDVWKIGVAISLSNGISSVLPGIARDILGLKAPIGEVEKAFKNWGLAIGGTVAILAGGTLIDGVFKMAQGGKDLLDQQDKLQRAGISYAKVLQVQGDYYKNIAANIPTASADQYLKTINEMQSVVGMDRAQQVAPFALKLDAIVANATGTDSDGAGFSLWRALEMRGTTMTDLAGSQKLADAMAQDIIGSAGKLNADTYQTLARRGGAAWAGASPDFITGPLSVVAADMGGSTTGTALMSLYQFLSGAGTITKQQYGVLSDAHLIDPSKVSTDRGGRINLEPGAIRGSAEGMRDPYQWTKDILTPALMKLANGDQATFNSLLAKIGRNRNVDRMLTVFSDPGFLEQIAKDQGNWARAMPIDQAYGAATAQNPDVIEAAFDAQKKSMFEAIGAPMMQAAIPVMQAVTQLFGQIGNFANSNPGAIKLVGEGMLGLGAGLVVLGGIAVVAAAAMLIPGGAVAVAVVAIGGIITALAALNWSTVAAGLGSLYGVLKQVIPSVIPGFQAAAAGHALEANSGWQLLLERHAADPMRSHRPPMAGVHPSSFIPPASQELGMQPVNLIVDGRKLAAVMTRRQAQAANGPMLGSSYFDPTNGMTPVGAI